MGGKNEAHEKQLKKQFKKPIVEKQQQQQQQYLKNNYRIVNLD